MNTYIVVQEGSFFAVRLGDSSGQVLATFSNKMAAETFVKKQQLKDQGARHDAPAPPNDPTI